MGLSEDENLWRGIAEKAKQQEAILAAHRTGRGEWFAVIELARADNERAYCWEMITAIHAKQRAAMLRLRRGDG